MNNKSFVEYPEVLITHPKGSIIHNNKIISFPDYEGQAGDLVKYYSAFANIYNWSNEVTYLIIEEVITNCSTVHLSDILKLPLGFKEGHTPFAFGKDLQHKTRSNGILIYGIVMITLVLLLNICIIALHNRITWNITTHYCLSILTLMGCAAFALCVWTNNSNNNGK